jgi:uncharacterized membrane protein
MHIGLQNIKYFSKHNERLDQQKILLTFISQTLCRIKTKNTWKIILSFDGINRWPSTATLAAKKTFLEGSY